MYTWQYTHSFVHTNTLFTVAIMKLEKCCVPISQTWPSYFRHFQLFVTAVILFAILIALSRGAFPPSDCNSPKNVGSFAVSYFLRLFSCALVFTKR